MDKLLNNEENVKKILGEETVIILDTENDYKELAKMLDGKVVDINTKKSGVVNPFLIVTEN